VNAEGLTLMSLFFSHITATSLNMSIFNLMVPKTQQRGRVRFELPGSSLVYYVVNHTSKGQWIALTDGNSDQPNAGKTINFLK